MDRGAWWATVHGVIKSQTQLSSKHTHTHTHTYEGQPGYAKMGNMREGSVPFQSFWNLGYSSFLLVASNIIRKMRSNNK